MEKVFCIVPQETTRVLQSWIHIPIRGLKLALKVLQPNLESHCLWLVSCELKMQSDAECNTGKRIKWMNLIYYPGRPCWSYTATILNLRKEVKLAWVLWVMFENLTMKIFSPAIRFIYCKETNLTEILSLRFSFFTYGIYNFNIWVKWGPSIDIPETLKL